MSYYGRDKLKLIVRNLKLLVDALESEVYSDVKSYTERLDQTLPHWQITTRSLKMTNKKGNVEGILNNEDWRYNPDRLKLRLNVFMFSSIGSVVSIFMRYLTGHRTSMSVQIPGSLKVMHLPVVSCLISTLYFKDKWNVWRTRHIWEALQHFGTRVEVIAAMEMGGRISAEDISND